MDHPHHRGPDRGQRAAALIAQIEIDRRYYRCRADADQCLRRAAEYERTLINERSAAAREARRALGLNVGRPKTVTPDQARQVRALHEMSESVPTLVATFGVSRATVYLLPAEEATTVTSTSSAMTSTIKTLAVPRLECVRSFLWKLGVRRA